MKSLKLKTMWADYNVITHVANYRNNNNLYIGLIDNEDGCPFADLTVNLGEKLEDECMAYVDTNNCPWAKEFIEKNELGEDTGLFGMSGFCAYPLFMFDLDKVKEYAYVED